MIRRTSIAFAVALFATLAACKPDSKKSTEGTSDSPSSSAKKKSRGGSPESAITKLFGEDGFGIVEGTSDPNALMGAVAAPHSAEEPEKFNAAWVGVEAASILRRAKKGEFESTTKSTSETDCIIFHENGVIRRMMTTYEEETHEFEMSEAGNIIIWLGAQRGGDEFRELAFFHRGKDLALHQTWNGNGKRSTTPPPAELKEIIFNEARGCYRAFGAKNPDPGSSAAPPPAPAKTESTHTFKVSATTFKEGEAIELTYDSALAAPAKNQFWVTLIKADAPDGEFGKWHYVAAGATTDSLTALAPGDYEVRLHDAFPMFPFRVMSRQRISVVQCRAASDCGSGERCDAGACVSGKVLTPVH